MKGKNLAINRKDGFFMKKRLIIALLLAFTLLLASCGASGGSLSDGEYESPSYSVGDKVYEDGMNGAFGDAGEVAGEIDRKIVKTVNETVETEDYDGFIKALVTAVSEAGGYVANSSFTGGGIYGTASGRRASFEVRIPSESLSDFTGAVDGLGAVTQYTESLSDLTLSYVDITSRISVLEAEESALLSILATATKTEDILAIRESLTEVQGELASLRSRQRVIDDKVAYSTVNITLREVNRVKAARPSFGEEIGVSFTESLEEIGGGFRAFAVWLIGDSLYILLVLALALLVILAARKILRRLGKKEGSEEKKEEEVKS